MGGSLSLKHWLLGPVITALGAAGHIHSTHQTQKLDKMKILALGLFSHLTWANSTPSPACLIPKTGKPTVEPSPPPVYPDQALRRTVLRPDLLVLNTGDPVTTVERTV